MTGAHTLSGSLADFVSATGFADLPDDVVASTRRRVLDTVGVAWAGSSAPGCEAAEASTLADGARAASTLWASGAAASCRGAAFVNGMHAAALDYDSVYEKGSVHPDIVVVPAAWAVAEACGASGKAFLAAVALGNEVACRLGAANRRNVGWFYSSVHGVFGAAAAAGKLYGLDADGIADALGLALGRAAGSQQAIVEKSLAKRAQSGFAAEAGVHCAQLAVAGLSGPRQAIEGRFGYHALYGEGDGHTLLAGLGARYEVLATAIKKYPSCTANHVPVDLLIAVANEHDLAAGDIARIEVEISPFADGLVGAPFDPSGNAQVAAQFSIHYSAASAALRRRLGIAEIQDAAVLDRALAGFLPRIAVTVDPGNHGKFAPAAVRVHTVGGDLIERRSSCVPGTLEDPLSDAQVAEKFLDCAGFGVRPLAPEAAAALAAGLMKLDERADLRGVFDGVRY